MSFLVVCSFDLKNGSADDYKNAYAALAGIGLNKAVVSSDNRRIVAPTTTTIGEFNGPSVGAVRDGVRTQVQGLFRSLRLTSEIFVVIGGDWAWGAATT